MTAALALDYFARSKVDIAVIETGLGGRLDASNVLSPLLTIITDISKDHVEILGSTLEQIAGEKAGIIKPNTPNLVGAMPQEALKVIRTVCREKDSPLHRLRRSDYISDAAKNRLSFDSCGFTLKDVNVSLPGAHQLTNAAVVVKALAILKERRDVKVTKKAIRDGLGNTVWPGRFQIIRQDDGPTLILDVCHNIGSVTAFVETFQNCFPGRKGKMITGFVKRKPHQAMFDLLSRVTESNYVVPLNTKRTIDMKEMTRELNWRNVPVKRFGSLRTAYNRLLKSCDHDDIICIIGSHFLVGEFLEMNGWQ